MKNETNECLVLVDFIVASTENGLPPELNFGTQITNMIHWREFKCFLVRVVSWENIKANKWLNFVANSVHIQVNFRGEL